jgi:hypothetical protein
MSKYSYLNYGIRAPLHAQAQRPVNNGGYIVTTAEEADKISIYNPRERIITSTNVKKNETVFQEVKDYEFVLQTDDYCVCPNIFGVIRLKNKNTTAGKNILHTAPMVNVKVVSIEIAGNTWYHTKKDEIYIHHCIRLSHGDKMFSNLIKKFGISTDYDIDPITNDIAPGETNEYMFCLPLFANQKIPWRYITKTSNEVVIKITLDKNCFITAASPNQDKDDVILDDFYLSVHELQIPPEIYELETNYPGKYLQFRVNDTRESANVDLSTSTLRTGKYTVEINSKQGPVSLFLFGLREKDNIETFADFIPIDDLEITTKSDKRLKEKTWKTDVMKVLQVYDTQMGEFFLKKNIYAYAFDANVAQIVVKGHHGNVEFMEDLYKISFTIPNATSVINPSKQYELVILEFKPKLLNLYPEKHSLEVKS